MIKFFLFVLSLLTIKASLAPISPSSGFLLICPKGPPVAPCPSPFLLMGPKDPLQELEGVHFFFRVKIYFVYVVFFQSLRAATW